MACKRVNDASSASYDNQLFASGTFKLVYKGIYTGGVREGQACVVKVFKTGSVYEESYFQQELDICDATALIVDAFNQQQHINRTIYVNTPAVWEQTGGGFSNTIGQKLLVEPMIENFEKFNSNSGWVSATGAAWADAMQALSHFSYHFSGGSKLFCDVQGGVYSNGFILTDPVIMTQAGGFGPADLGPDGIRSFFARHKCNKFCKADWSRPRHTGGPLLPATKGSLMMALPTRQSRNPLSRLREE